MKTSDIRGIIPPVITPMNNDPEQTVNHEALRQQVERLLAGGVHGMFPLGTNGEAYALSFKEKEEVLATVIDQVKGRVPIYAGTGCITTAETIRMSRRAEEMGADAFRLYEMFMGAFDQPIPWSTQGARGCRRFLDRIWRMQDMVNDFDGIRPEMKALVHGTIKKVSEDYEAMKYNTAIAAMMTMVNELYNNGSVSKEEFHILLTLLNPVAPHMTEELNQRLGYEQPLYCTPWPKWDESALVKNTIEYGVQVNGKIRARIELPIDMPKEEVEAAAKAHKDVVPFLEGKTVRKVIVVKNIVNIVVA